MVLPHDGNLLLTTITVTPQPSLSFSIRIRFQMSISLPPKLIDKIITEIPFERPCVGTGRMICNPDAGPISRSLAALSATCRTLREQIAPILFSSIKFENGYGLDLSPEDASCAEEEISRFPELMRHVR